MCGRYNQDMGKWGIILALALGVSAVAQEYDGPNPPKPDIPYLLHAHNLIEPEISEAQLVERNNEDANIIAGASSPVRTPLAEPIFIFESQDIPVEDLSLWQMETTKNTREIAFPNNPERQRRRGPFPVHLTVKPLAGDMYWLEVNQYLENGEYCMSPNGSQTVFCFQIY